MRELAATRTRAAGVVRLTLSEDVAELVIDNPAARNAMTVHMMVDFADAVIELEGWSGARLIVRGEGERAFCSGGHLRDVQSALLAPTASERMSIFMHDVLGRFARLPVVTVAAVEGAALGGGAEILTACDFIVASSTAKIGFVQAALGLSTGWGGATRLVQAVGAKRALNWLAFPTPRSAAAGHADGWVDRVCAPGAALAETRAWFSTLDQVPAEAVRAMKANVRSAQQNPPDLALAEERQRFLALWGGPAHRAALSRIFE
jgi:ethylmalonyl-CoA/methylmalonyl-CoA decarboxylase